VATKILLISLASLKPLTILRGTPHPIFVFNRFYSFTKLGKFRLNHINEMRLFAGKYMAFFSPFILIRIK
jgi:hypothetical protein